METNTQVSVSLTSSPPPRFKGQPVELGGVTYIVPPLALGALKGGLLERIRATRRPGEMPPLELVSEVVLAALQRNYPELEMAVLDELDAGEITKVFEAFVLIVERSGFHLKSAEGPSGNGAPRES